MMKNPTRRADGGPVRRYSDIIGIHGADKLRISIAAIDKRQERDVCVCPTCGDQHLNEKARDRMKKARDRMRRITDKRKAGI